MFKTFSYVQWKRYL